MVNIVLCGCNGKMGHYIVDAAQNNNQCKIACGVDAFGENSYDFPTVKSFAEIDTRYDVIVDFSNPATLDDLLSYAVKYNVPAVICTTGYSKHCFLNKEGKPLSLKRSFPHYHHIFKGLL